MNQTVEMTLVGSVVSGQPVCFITYYGSCLPSSCRLANGIDPVAGIALDDGDDGEVVTVQFEGNVETLRDNLVTGTGYYALANGVLTAVVGNADRSSGQPVHTRRSRLGSRTKTCRLRSDPRTSRRAQPPLEARSLPRPRTPRASSGPRTSRRTRRSRLTRLRPLVTSGPHRAMGSFERVPLSVGPMGETSQPSGSPSRSSIH
jgi:hypothetical protein